MDGFLQITSVEHICIEQCERTDRVLEALILGLPSNKTLKRLEVSVIDYYDKVVDYGKYVRSIGLNRSLEWVSFRREMMSGWLMNRIEDSLRSRKGPFALILD